MLEKLAKSENAHLFEQTQVQGDVLVSMYLYNGKKLRIWLQKHRKK